MPMCKEIKVTYNGKGVSLNSYYSQGHWSKRQNIKKKYSAIFSVLLSELNTQTRFSEFVIYVFYNSRIDPDNVGGIEKVFTDTLRREGFVADDNKKYCKGIYFIPDTSLEKDTYEFIVQDAATRNIAQEMREFVKTRQYNL